MFPKNSGFPPQIRVFHYFHHPFWGIRIFGNTHIENIGREPKGKKKSSSNIISIFRCENVSAREGKEVVPIEKGGRAAFAVETTVTQKKQCVRELNNFW